MKSLPNINTGAGVFWLRNGPGGRQASNKQRVASSVFHHANYCGRPFCPFRGIPHKAYLISLVALAVVVIDLSFLVAAENNQGWETAIDNKGQIMATLNEIEFDYQTNKLSDEDYHHLRRKFERACYRLYHQEEQLVLRQQEGKN